MFYVYRLNPYQDIWDDWPCVAFGSELALCFMAVGSITILDLHSYDEHEYIYFCW